MALVRREVILAKIESTYNVDSVPVAGTDGVLVENPAWSHEGANLIERNGVKATLGKTKSIFGSTLKSVTFDVEVKGSGAAGTAPEIGPLLRACGMDETIVASTSVTYAPISAAFESITIYYYADGIRHIITGARGNVSFTLEAGQAAKASFTFTGHDGGVSDSAMVSPTYDTTVPAPLVNVPFTIGGYSAAISSLSFDMGNTVAFPQDIRSSDGYGEVIINARDVNGSFNPEQVLLATNDFIGGWKSGADLALSTGVIGGAAGNRFAVSMPAVTYRDVAPGDREGLRTFEIGYGAGESSGDDEVSIAFT